MLVNKIKVGATLLILLLSIGNVFAQEGSAQTPSLETADQLSPLEEGDEDGYKPLDFGLDLKTMHLWRGFQVTPGAMTGASVFYVNRPKTFKVGFWGGAGFTGEYKEICFFLHKEFNNISFDVLNSFNSTGYVNPNILSFDRSTSAHFLDVTVGYTLPGIPLKTSLSTMVLGRDIYNDENGYINNRYSHYAEVKYTAWKANKSSLNLFVGGAFSMEHETTFYSKKPNLVNVGLELNRTVSFLSLSLPLSATLQFNPERKHAAIEFAAHIF